MVAKEALAQPISAWPCIRDLNLPPNKRVPLFFSEKHYDASSSVIYNLYDGVDLASAEAEIRHVFGDTPITEASIGAAPPDILVKLSGPEMYVHIFGERRFGEQLPIWGSLWLSENCRNAPRMTLLKIATCIIFMFTTSERRGAL